MRTTDTAASIHLLDDFVTYLSNLDDPNGVMADDLEGEFNFPHQSFSLQGRTAFEDLHSAADPEPWRITVRNAQPLPDGLFIDADIHSAVGHSRTATILAVTGDKITGMQHWCTGDLGPEGSSL